MRCSALPTCSPLCGCTSTAIVAATRARPDQLYFWATHGGAEIDLLLIRGTERVGFEIKRTTAPRVTAGLRSAIDTLRLDRAYLVHAGESSYPGREGVQMLAARELAGIAGLRTATSCSAAPA